MYMPYSNNPNMPKVRRDAAFFAMEHGVRTAAKRYGVSPGTVSKWLQKVELYGHHPIPTLTSRPHHHPRELREEVVGAILEARNKHHRCAEIVHQEVLRQGFTVSLSSVERTLERKGLVRKRSPWKRWHFTLPRPEAAKPGFLVQIDTIHVAPRRSLVFPKFYVYTLLDVFSRWAFARVSARINTHRSLSFLKEAQRQAPFPFAMLQSDHGSEFSSWFTEQVKVEHRHSRVRQPNDNGHLERFNRTIQEECLNKVRLNPRSYQEAIDEYLPYYNNERMHLSLNFKTPSECFQASD
ncbi:DDE-type integrase/transposase/recombinase [Candidatus Uhrbacteria bacterium]|nr:DDE-type integrase/transposase/recombinase [Candidatus Uhrbacteria bacterium]